MISKASQVGMVVLAETTETIGHHDNLFFCGGSSFFVAFAVRVRPTNLEVHEFVSKNHTVAHTDSEDLEKPSSRSGIPESESVVGCKKVLLLLLLLLQLFFIVVLT